ncbi:MAG TPA: hypothetical protein VFS21_07345 [Roseiflexaceae bacterium]|nr:hypothetical protein [Roseiflexaceae bacterium]
MNRPNLPSHSRAGICPCPTGRAATRFDAPARPLAPSERPSPAAPDRHPSIYPTARRTLRPHPSDRTPQFQRTKHPPGHRPALRPFD